MQSILSSSAVLLAHNNTTGSIPVSVPPADAPAIAVSQGCLLVPVFFAAWWYYTKKCIRKIRGLIRHTAEPHDIDDSERFYAKFTSLEDSYFRWEDMSPSASQPSSPATGRFVKWINRRNVRRRHMMHEINKTTERMMQQGPTPEEGMVPEGQPDALYSPYGLEESISNLRQGQWDTLTELEGLELCSVSMQHVEDYSYIVRQPIVPQTSLGDFARSTSSLDYQPSANASDLSESSGLEVYCSPNPS
eukprot:Nitzschia sp. Nitz4//scaffold79_size90958//31957//32774//NITZ4_005018-RA/size90958-augustus-gene-0.169-mRNA-1//1//CDS//3329558228//548//frame0